MKITKIILSIVTMLFALLGLLKVISFDIANPIMLLALATFIVIRLLQHMLFAKLQFIIRILNK